MRQSHGSRSARVVATLRAMHQLLPGDRKLHADPQAVHLVQGFLGTRLVRSPYWMRWVESLRPGAAAQIAARDHFADNWARRTLSGRCQVLLMGAGFDSMTLRLQGEFPEAVFFEIDRPETQQEKVSLLSARKLMPAPERCRFIASNFEQNDLLTALPSAGYDAALPTFANWMGVSYYLGLPAIRQMLLTFQTLLSPGSAVAMDYFAEQAAPRHSGWQRMLKRFGEPIKTILTDDELVSLAAEYGFEVPELTTAAKISGRTQDAPISLMRLAALRKRPA